MAKANEYYKPPESDEAIPDSLGDIKEIRVSPDFYMHQAIVKAIDALSGSENLKEGMIRYRLLIEQLEMLCRAVGRLDPAYYEEIEAYRKGPEYAAQGEDYARSFMLAQKKFDLIMQRISEGQAETGSIRI